MCRIVDLQRLPHTLIVVTMLACASTALADKSPYEWAFVRLDYARQEKVRQFKHFCDQVHQAAGRAAQDPALLGFFDVNRRYEDLKQQGHRPPEELVGQIEDLRREFTDHYIRNYLCFYDILMVDPNGNIFYTVRKESDFQHSLLEKEWTDTPLARLLEAGPQEEAFLDFHYYAASDEPAAFFVEPLHKDGRLIGWLVLQYAINKVNSLFAGVEKLGATGETILVNRHGYMLTESNFQGESTILTMRLDDQNIQPKFAQGHGHRMVVDYRGHGALTSFEVIDFLKTQWLIVAKVDEDEIVTEHFQQHQQYYTDRLLRVLTATEAQHTSEKPALADDRKVIKVDMDEFVRASHNESLHTVGVSTCTAVIATYPGKFGYLAHISPNDKVYGGDATNILAHVIKKIKTYDIYKYERDRVRFVIVARHGDSLSRIVNKLVAEGFLLSQLSVLHGPSGHYANVTYDYVSDRISVEWVANQASNERTVQYGGNAQNLGRIVKRLITEADGMPQVGSGLAGRSRLDLAHQ